MRRITYFLIRLTDRQKEKKFDLFFVHISKRNWYWRNIMEIAFIKRKKKVKI